MAIRRFRVRNGEGTILLEHALIVGGVLELDDERPEHIPFLTDITTGVVNGYTELVPEPEDDADEAPKKKGKAKGD